MRNLKRPSFLALATLCGFAAVLPAQAQQQPVRGGTLILSMTQDPSTVNPAISSNIPDRQVGCIAYQGLVQATVDYKLTPLLAKSWTISPDGLTYSFDLVAAKWHDGKPFTSEDVKFSLIDVNTKFSSVYAAAGDRIAAIETPAPDKLVIKLKEPFGPFLFAQQCRQGGAIIPAHVFKGTNPRSNPATLTDPVGTGPFKMGEWKRSQYVRLDRNPDYFEQGRPYLDSVIARIIGQPTARTQAIKAGEVDLVYRLAANDRTILLADPNLTIGTADSSPTNTVMFANLSRKPLDDKRVRQALAAATDREYLNKFAFAGDSLTSTMPFPTMIPWIVNPDIDYRKMYPFDKDKANAMLDAAGYKRDASGKRFGVKLTIYATQYPEFQQVAIALKSMWQAIGVELTSESLEDATLIQKVFTERDFDLSLQSYASYGDPAIGVARTFSSGQVGKPNGNAAGYSNPEIDKLFADGERALSNEDRAPFYKKAQVILAEDLPTLPMREYTPSDALSKRVHDLWGKYQGYGDFTNAWVAK